MRYRSAFVVAAVCWFAATPAAAAEPDDVVTIWEAGGLQPGTIEAVRVAATMERGTVTIRRSGTMRLMGVTRDGVDVQRPAQGFGYPMSVLSTVASDPTLSPDIIDVLRRGRLVMSERSAALRGAQAGDVVELEGWNRETIPIIVGAVVPDADIDWYEIVIGDAVAARLYFDRPSAALVSVADPGALVKRLRGAVAAGPIRVGTSSDPISFADATLPTVVVKERFGEFSYRPTGVGDGVELDQEWLDRNIVTAFIPGLGAFKCNRAVVPYVRAAIAEAKLLGLAGEIDYTDFQLAGGCFNARLMRGTDQGYALSRHAWGIAIDVNPSTNGFGKDVNLSEAFGDVMRRWGFAWGATWTLPDGMHFEWVRPPVDVRACPDHSTSTLSWPSWPVVSSGEVCEAIVS